MNFLKKVVYLFLGVLFIAPVFVFAAPPEAQDITKDPSYIRQMQEEAERARRAQPPAETPAQFNARTQEILRQAEALAARITALEQARNRPQSPLERDRQVLMARVILPPIDEATYARNLELAKRNFNVDRSCGSNAGTQAAVLQALAMQLMTDPDVREGRPFKGGVIQVRCKIGQMGAGGATTFSFSGTGGVVRVLGFDMTVQGSLERVLDSVLTHETAHCVSAAACMRPLPRWGDEGAATLFENDSERLRQYKLLEEFIMKSRGNRLPIPINELLTITEYPKDMQAVLALYAEGAALIDFLTTSFAQGFDRPLSLEEAHRLALAFLDEAHTTGWDAALKKYTAMLGLKPLVMDGVPVNIGSVPALAASFEKWIKSGYPDIALATPRPTGILPAGFTPDK